MDTIDTTILSANLHQLERIEALVRVRRFTLESPTPPKGLVLRDVSDRANIWTCYEEVRDEGAITWTWKEKPLKIVYCMFGGKHTYTKVLCITYDDQKFHLEIGDYARETTPDPEFLMSLFEDIAGKKITKLKTLIKFLSSIGIPEDWVEDEEFTSLILD